MAAAIGLDALPFFADENRGPPSISLDITA